MARLACRACGRHLTRPCDWGRPDQRDETAGDEQSPIPLGLMIRMGERGSPIHAGDGRQVGTHLFSPDGAIALHPEAIIAGALVTSGRDSGCCGSSGCDGPNRACTCGNVVAMQWSDCWTWAEVQFLPDAVAEVP